MGDDPGEDGDDGGPLEGADVGPDDEGALLVRAEGTALGTGDALGEGPRLDGRTDGAGRLLSRGAGVGAEPAAPDCPGRTSR